MFEHPRIHFYGGPYDGLYWPIPKSNRVDRLLLVAYEPDPSQLALYGIRESALEAEQQEVIYDFAGMIPVSVD
ncbi:hypothetical protein ACIQSP_16535 [Streptomyces nigra]|uniref:hypothetical protein n=1 Tax=Streptomyces nigra TaxID=1827580 RepID=UPI003809643C